MHSAEESIRILIADDDEHILECYREAFGVEERADATRELKALDAELFDDEVEVGEAPSFEVVACRQGLEAVEIAKKAARDGCPFDVVILDIRMPPGISGVEAGSRIREVDPDVEIIFVSGFSDVPRAELEQRVPPPMKLHYFNKPLSFVQLAEDVAGMVHHP